MKEKGLPCSLSFYPIMIIFIRKLNFLKREYIVEDDGWIDLGMGVED